MLESRRGGGRFKWRLQQAVEWRIRRNTNSRKSVGWCRVQLPVCEGGFRVEWICVSCGIGARRWGDVRESLGRQKGRRGVTESWG